MTRSPIPYRVITVAGITCAGATTLIRALAKEIGFEHSNPASGEIRAYLQAHNLPISAVKEVPTDIDRRIDAHAKSIIHNATHVIIGGRVSGWLAEGLTDVFRVYVTASLEKRVERFAARENFSLVEARQALKIREQAELAKYQALYDLDITDPKWYDLIVDTTNCRPQEALTQVLQQIT